MPRGIRTHNLPGEQPKTYSLDRATTGTGIYVYICNQQFTYKRSFGRRFEDERKPDFVQISDIHITTQEKMEEPPWDWEMETSRKDNMIKLLIT